MKVFKYNSAIFSIIITLSVMGGTFKLSYEYLILFSLNSAVMAAYQLKMWLLNSNGFSGIKTAVFGTIVGGLINLVLCIILIRPFGVFGAAFSITFSNIFLYWYYSHFTNKLIITERNHLPQ